MSFQKQQKTPLRFLREEFSLLQSKVLKLQEEIRGSNLPKKEGTV